MSDVTILGKVQIDTGESAKSINDLKSEISQASKAMKEAKIGSDEYKQAQKQLKQAEDELTKSMAAAKEEKDKSSESFGILKEKLNGLVPGLKGAEGGVTSFGAQLKILAANPIVLLLTAIVGSLAFLYEAFTSTSAGANKMKEIFAGVSAVIENIANRAIHFGRAILDFLSGDFKGASKDFHEATDNVIGDMEETFKTAVKLKGERIKLNKEIKESELKTLMQKERLADLKAQLADENISAKDKLKIAQQLKEEQQKLSGILTDQEKKNKELSLKEVAEKYGVEGSLAIKVADLKEKLLKAETEIEKEEIKKQISEFTLKAKNQSEFSSAVNDILKSNHETMKAINDDDRAVNKATKAANKQANAEDATAQKEAAQKRKEAKDNERAYDEKMLKYSQEQQLASIKDTNQKELKALEFKSAAELEVNKKSLAEGKITKDQYHQLSLAEEQAFMTQRDALIRKHDDEIRKTEIEFEKQLAEIKKGTDLSEETNQRKKELATLKADLEAKTKAILDNEKFTYMQKQIILQALNIEQRTKELAINKKFDEEETKAANARALKDIVFEMAHNKNKFSLLQKLLTDKQRIIDKQYADELRAAKGNADKIKDIEQKHTEDIEANTEARKALIKAELDAKLSAMDAIAGSFTNGAKLLGESTTAGKALALASAAISTFTSAQKAYEATVGIPYIGPFLAPINAGLAVAAGLQNMQNIASVQVPGGGGGSSVPNVSVSSPVSPQPIQTSTSLNNSSIQGIGNAAGNTGKLFVLDRDIKDNAERDAVLTRRARLG